MNDICEHWFLAVGISASTVAGTVFFCDYMVRRMTRAYFKEREEHLKRVFDLCNQEGVKE